MGVYTRGRSYQVKRERDGGLTATFYVRAAADLQDKLWGRWGSQIPRLVDREPNVPSELLAKLLDRKHAELPSLAFAELLAAHPARDATPSSDGSPLLGEYLGKVWELWKNGNLPWQSRTALSKKSVNITREGLNKLVYELEYERDGRGYRRRDKNGDFIVRGWGATALAWTPIGDVTSAHILELDRRVREDKVIGIEVWRKVRSFLMQAFQYARLGKIYTDPNPVRDVPAPKQTGVREVRQAYLPDKVELIRADFLYLERLAQARVRGRLVEHDVGKIVDGDGNVLQPPVPVPDLPGFAADCADLLETFAYGGCRPGEALAAEGGHVEEKESFLRIEQRNVDGQIVPGTKSKRYPFKDVYLLGPLPSTLRRRAETAGEHGLLFPWPGTDKPWTEEQYRRFRDRYFGPIARARGLQLEDDDPYTLRHVYASLRAAAGHSPSAINASMGTTLAERVYTTVFRKYQAKPLKIDKTIARARNAALKARGLTGTGDAGPPRSAAAPHPPARLPRSEHRTQRARPPASRH